MLPSLLHIWGERSLLQNPRTREACTLPGSPYLNFKPRPNRTCQCFWLRKKDEETKKSILGSSLPPADPPVVHRRRSFPNVQALGLGQRKLSSPLGWAGSS